MFNKTPVVLSASRDLQVGDTEQTLIYLGSGDINLTIPAALPDGFGCEVVQFGAGTVIFVGGPGAVVTGPAVSTGPSSSVKLFPLGHDEYVVQQAAGGAGGGGGGGGASGYPATGNAVVNGDMQVWQRGIEFSGAFFNAADRWTFFVMGSAQYTGAQSEDVPTLAQSGRIFSYSIELACVTPQATMAAADLIRFSQEIEGQFLMPLAERPWVLSFWVKAPRTGKYGVGMHNNGNDRGFLGEYTINAAGVWEFKSILIPAPPAGGDWDYGTGTGLQLTFTLASGTDYMVSPSEVGVWVTTGGNSFASTDQVNSANAAGSLFFTGIDLSAGTTVPTAFVQRTFSEELRLCQRYFYKTFSYETVPGESYESYGSVAAISVGPSKNCAISIRFPVAMRGNPNVTVYSSSNDGSHQIYDHTTGLDCSGSSANWIGESGCTVVGTTPATSVLGGTLSVQITADMD